MEGYRHLRESGLTNDEARARTCRWVFQWVEHFLTQVIPWIEAAAKAHADSKQANGGRPPGGWADGGSDYQEGDSDSTA